VYCAVGDVCLPLLHFAIIQSDETYGALSEACLGNTVPTVAAYTAIFDIHPTIVLKLDGTNCSLFRRTREGIVGRCFYRNDHSDNPTHIVERHRYELPIELVEAKSGILITEETLVGKVPREYPNEDTFLKDSETVTIDHEKVSNAVTQL
jgi:hypothetical protein